MKCDITPDCDFENISETWSEAQIEHYKHAQAVHPQEWEKFMDWVLD